MRRIVAVCYAIGALTATRVTASDADDDGMSDDYETFFRLDLTNAADGALNYDGDSLVNSNEAALGTDPWSDDTDQDGFADDADDVPISRLFVAWGTPEMTSGDDYLYAAPNWWVATWKAGGAWMTNPPAWYTGPPDDSSNALFIAFDPSHLTNSSVLEVNYLAGSNAILAVDLLDADDALVVSALYANLVGPILSDAHTNLFLPLAQYTNATQIRIRREGGESLVYGNLMYVDHDQDGLDADQEDQLGTSDDVVDSDGDELTDYAETFVFETDATAADTDGDLVEDGFEIARGTQATNAASKNIRISVDTAAGSDSYDGYRATFDGVHGPKRTIGGGISAAAVGGDVVNIAAGTYTNEPATFSGTAGGVRFESSGNVIIR